MTRQVPVSQVDTKASLSTKSRISQHFHISVGGLRDQRITFPVSLTRTGDLHMMASSKTCGTGAGHALGHHVKSHVRSSRPRSRGQYVPSLILYGHGVDRDYPAEGARGGRMKGTDLIPEGRGGRGGRPSLLVDLPSLNQSTPG